MTKFCFPGRHSIKKGDKPHTQVPQFYVEQGSAKTKTEQTSAEPVTESAPAVESRETERIEVHGDVQCAGAMCVVHLVRVVQIEVRHRHRWTFLASY